MFFELNGQPRDITIIDSSVETQGTAAVKADPANPCHVGASMPGMVVTVGIAVGDNVRKGQKLLTLEAMKMETAINAELDGKVKEVLVKPGITVQTGDLLVILEP